MCWGLLFLLLREKSGLKMKMQRHCRAIPDCLAATGTGYAIERVLFELCSTGEAKDDKEDIYAAKTKTHRSGYRS